MLNLIKKRFYILMLDLIRAGTCLHINSLSVLTLTSSAFKINAS